MLSTDLLTDCRYSYLNVLYCLCVQDMQSRMPSDPFEAELLMMAEAVASGGRESDSESEVSDDDNCKTPAPLRSILLVYGHSRRLLPEYSLRFFQQGVGCFVG